MSISEPDLNIAFQLNKRGTEITFFVDEKYYNERSNLPAWEYSYISDKINLDSQNTNKDSLDSPTYNRFIREIFTGQKSFVQNQESTPWHCNYKIKWIDLGRDYYPRYIRSVECIKKECWYDYN
uniref:Uncharacterized protein n=1 Tax=Megaselia scalaris TaxID=36166 RepID=T1GNZ0_MEGSC